MKNFLIVWTSIIIATLNINALGELDYKLLEKSKQKSHYEQKIILNESINWSFGSTVFKLIHFAEILFISEIGRRKTRIIN
ncbi:hypothetical protein [Polaribacter sp. R77954]|uniref:hypothetical protein n=1 Tax=Polaribacter sp. R77954 TaxID=3093870 RepID=UPI0037C5ACA2